MQSFHPKVDSFNKMLCPEVFYSSYNTVMFNVVEHPGNKLVSVISYIIVTIYSRSLASLSFPSLKKNAACHVTEKPQSPLS